MPQKVAMAFKSYIKNYAEIKPLNRRLLSFYGLPPLLALVVWLGVQFKTDLSAFIIAGENAEQVLLASEMQSGALSRRYLMELSTKDAKPLPAGFMQAFTAELKAIDGVAAVWSPEQNADVPENLQQLYGAHASAWYSLKPEQDLPALFSATGLQQRAQLLKQALLSPQGTVIKALALEDPLLLALSGFQTQNTIVPTPDQSASQLRHLLVETKADGLDVPVQQRIQTAIKSAFQILDNAENLQVKLAMTGVPIFAVATQNLLQGDIKLISVLSTLGLLALFLVVFRSASALLQVFTILLLAILSAIITTQLVFGYVHGMTVAIGSTLVGICIDYPIHAIAHAQSVNAEQRRAIIAKIWPSMVLGGITTLVGYFALGASGYPGFKQVAVYAASGISVSLLLTRFVLPQLLQTQAKQTLLIPLVAVWANCCQRFRPQLLAAVALMALVALIGATNVHWLTDMQDLTPELDYLKQNDKRIRAQMTSIEPGRFVLIADKTLEAALQKAEAVYPILDKLKQEQHLVDYYGLYPWLLSEKQQQQNQKLLQDYLNPENQVLWQQALQQAGLNSESLGQWHYPLATPLPIAQVLDSPVKKFIDSRVVQRDDQALLMIWLASHQPDRVIAALANLDGVQYISQRDMLNSMTQRYTQTAQLLLLLGMVLIVLLLFYRYKNIQKALQTLLPAALAAFMTFGFWAFTGIAISFLHLVGFLLVIAICVDYGIFYQENRGGDIALTYQAMAAAMLTSALAFACLLLSESTALTMLAGVVVLGVGFGFLLCPLVITLQDKQVP